MDDLNGVMPEKPNDGDDIDLEVGLASGGVSVLSTEALPDKGELGFLAAVGRQRKPGFKMLEH